MLIRFFAVSYLLSLALFGDAHILLMHRFDDSRYKSTNITTEQLRKDFEYLRKNKYKVVSFEYLLSHLYEDKLISFAIDDGYKSFYQNGLKLFREFNYPFTLFIYTEAIDNRYPDFMTWEQIKRTSQFGEIGIHSDKHPHLTHLDPISIMKDTQKAISSYKNVLKTPPKYYAYPYGEYDKNSREIIEAFGFDAIFNQSMGAVSEDSDIYNLNRVALLGTYNIKTKLRTKFLKTEWIYPTKYPLNSLIKKITVRIPKGIKKAQLYISGYSWRTVDVKDGLIDIQFKTPIQLKFKQTRLFVKTFDNKIGSTILVK